MAHVIEGDDWKHQKPEEPKFMSRAECQQQADEARIRGEISRERWWEITDALSADNWQDAIAQVAMKQ